MNNKLHIIKKVSVCTYLFLFLYTFTGFSSNLTTYSWEFQPLTKEAYNLALQLKLKQSKELLNGSSTPSTSDIPQLYISNLAEALELLITEDESKLDTYESNWKKRVTQIKNSNSSPSPYKDFFLAEMQLQWAFIYLKFDSELSAAWNLRQAYRLISTNHENYPDFLPNLKTLGLLHVLLGAIPEKYEWILSLFGMEGSIKNGIDELETLVTSENMFQFEADILLQVVKAYVLQDKKSAVKGLSRLLKNHDKNPLVKFLYASILIKNAESEKALKVLQTLNPIHGDHIQFYYIYYLLGEVYLQKGRFKKAIESYDTFIKNFEGTNFIKSAHYKTALGYLLDGNESAFESYVKKASQRGSKKVEGDKYAAKMAKSGQKPNSIILSIRLLSDGGYYQQADSIVRSVPEHYFKTPKDKVEFKYRQARLSHKTNAIKKASEQYKQVIEASGKSPWYFAPNSALQLGYIFRATGDNTSARKYFLKALSYNNHEYKSSIDNKAKIALSTL